MGARAERAKTAGWAKRAEDADLRCAEAEGAAGRARGRAEAEEKRVVRARADVEAEWRRHADRWVNPST